MSCSAELSMKIFYNQGARYAIRLTACLSRQHRPCSESSRRSSLKCSICHLGSCPSSDKRAYTNLKHSEKCISEISWATDCQLWPMSQKQGVLVAQWVKR